MSQTSSSLKCLENLTKYQKNEQWRLNSSHITKEEPSNFNFTISKNVKYAFFTVGSFILMTNSGINY